MTSIPKACRARSLKNALLKVRSENPVDRKPTEFCKWLDNVDEDDFGRDEAVLCFATCVEGDRVSAAHADVMLLATLSAFARRGVHDKFIDIWETARDERDLFLARLWAGTGVKDTARSEWLVAHRFAVRPFFDNRRALDVISAVKDLAEYQPNSY